VFAPDRTVFGFHTFIVLLVISCIVPSLKNMNNHHAAFWSASTSPQENPYIDSVPVPRYCYFTAAL
jgi:hypothetical protein